MTGPAPAVDLLEVDLGPGVLAVFTRAGANLSVVVGPGVPDAGRAARRSLDARMGVPVAYVEQVHGADVLECAVAPEPGAHVGRADALLTTERTVAVAVLVADCVPVLLADPLAGVVAAVHAGRRGLVAGVVPAAVRAMQVRGADPRRVRAVIGPSVCGACYEVPDALRAEVDAAVPGTATTTSWGTPALDLPAGVRHQLMTCGVTGVVDVGACTLSDDGWFSHRGSVAAPAQRPPGRFAGVVRLLPTG